MGRTEHMGWTGHVGRTKHVGWTEHMRQALARGPGLARSRPGPPRQTPNTARGRGEAGAATALGLGLLAAAVACIVAALLFSSAGLEQSRASSAAELAALAASDAARGIGAGGDPCAVAGEVAARNGARVLACRSTSALSADQGASAVVSVASERPPGWGVFPLPLATSQAAAGAPP